MSKAMRGDQQPAKGLASRLFWGVARGVAPFWMAPALIYNIHWHGQCGWQENATAVVLILVGALFFDNTVRARNIAAALLFACATVFMLYVNTKQATRNLSTEREAATHRKLTEIAGGSQVASQLEKERGEQIQVAGYKAVGVLKSEMRAIQNRDPKRWQDTSQCEDVSAKKSGDFLHPLGGGKSQGCGGQAARRNQARTGQAARGHGRRRGCGRWRRQGREGRDRGGRLRGQHQGAARGSRLQAD